MIFLLTDKVDCFPEGGTLYLSWTRSSSSLRNSSLNLGVPSFSVGVRLYMDIERWAIMIDDRLLVLLYPFSKNGEWNKYLQLCAKKNCGKHAAADSK